MKWKFITKTGEILEGKLVHQYPAFEGGMRYIFKVGNKEVRCIKDKDGNYVEYVA